MLGIRICKFISFLVLSFLLLTKSYAQNIPDYVPTAGLVSWYPFDGNTNDITPNANHAILYGPTLTQDKHGNPNSAYNFDGQSDYMEVLHSPSLNLTSISIAFWARSTDDGTQYLFDKKGGNLSAVNNGGFMYGVSAVPASGTSWSVSNGNTVFRMNSGTDNDFRNQGDWAHVAVTYDEFTGEQRVYLNGDERIGQVVAPGQLTASPLDLYIGKSHTYTGRNFEGQMDDVGIWDRALNQCEISQLYHEQAIEIFTNHSGTVCLGDSLLIWSSDSLVQFSNVWEINTPNNTYNFTGDTFFFLPDTSGVHNVSLFYDTAFCVDTTFNITLVNCSSCLVGDYSFFNNTLDSSGLGHHGTSTTGTFTPDRFGNPNSAYLFDGANDYIDINNNLPIITNTEFTLIAGAQMLGPGGGVEGDNVIFQQRNDIDNAPAGPATILFYAEENYSTNSTYRIGARKDGNGSLITADFPAVQDTQWHCFAASLGADDTLRLYLDHEEVARTPFTQQTGDFQTGIDHVSLGTHSYDNQPYRSFFNGKMDFVEVHNCYVDPIENCQTWLCQNFTAQVINDSASYPGCTNAEVSVDSIEYGHPPYHYAWSNSDTGAMTYLDAGTHSVTVTDSVGCMWADTFTVSAMPKPAVEIDTAGLVCPGQTLLVMSSDTQNLFQKSWEITRQSDTQTFTGDNIQSQINGGGNYEIKLYYTLNTCTDSTVMNFTLDTLPGITAQASVNYFPGCAGAEVTADSLSGYPPFQITWSNADTGTTTLYDIGTHTVTVTDSNTCTYIDTFQVQSAPPLEIDTAGPACLNDSILLISNDSGGLFQKTCTVTAPGGVLTKTGDTNYLQLTQSGTYQIALGYALNGCSDTAFYNFNLDTVPYVKAIVEANPFPGCAGAEVFADSLSGYQPLEILWSNNDTDITTYYDTGTHTITLTDAGNCTYTDTFKIQSLPPLLIDTVGSACYGEALTLQSSDTHGLFQKTWTVTNTAGTQTLTGDTLQTLLSATGSYQITLSYTRHNCADTSTYSFSLDTVPGLSVTTETNFFPGCAGGPVEAVQVTGYNPLNIQWSNNDTGSTTLYDSGSYTVTLTDGGNCTYTDTFYVAADSLVPVFDTLLGCEADTLLISAVGNLTAYQNIWAVTYPGGSTTYGGTNFPYPVPDTGFYNFELQYAKHGCNYSTSLSYHSTVLDLSGNLNYETNYFPGCEGALTSTDTIVGGRPFYSALWSNGDTNFFSYFDTGYHSITVADTVNCTWIDTFYVSPDTLSLLVRTEHQCPMDSLFLQTTDSADYLTKYWYIETPDSSHTINADTIDYFMNSPGQYHFNMVYTQYGCTDTLTYSAQPDTLETHIEINTRLNYFPGCAGAEVFAFNPIGSVPFEYLWSNTDTLTQTLYDTGLHQLTVTDGRGCEITKDFNVTPDSVDLHIERIPGCGTDTLYIFSTDSAGEFTKTIQQTGPDGTFTLAGDSHYVQISDTGLYTFTLTYSKKNCTRTTNNTWQKSIFDLAVQAWSEPNYFSGCSGAEAQLQTVEGGRPPYNFLWSNTDTGQITTVDTGYHTLTAFDSLGCPAHDTIYVNSAAANLITDTVHLCPYDSLFIKSTDTAGIFTKQWYITEPQGTNLIAGDSIAYHLNTPGTYYFDLEYSQNGCSDTLTFSLAPDTLVTRAQVFTDINYFPGCAGALIKLDNLIGQSPFQFNWSNTATTQNALHDTGTHSVTVTDSRNCKWQDTFNVATDSLTITVDTVLGCGTDTLYLQSSDSDGLFQKWWNITTPDSTTMIQGDSITFVTGDSGLYEFEFNYSIYSCSRQINYTYDVIDMDLPRNIVQIPPNVCEGDSFGLYIDDTTFVNTIDWITFGNVPVTLDKSDTFYFSYPQSGNYLIQAYTNEWCKIDTHTYDIRIHPIPVADLGPDTLFCEGDSFLINLQDTTFQYNWSNGDTSTFLRVLEPDTYSVTITSDYCGFDRDSVVIDSVIPALVHLPADTIMCVGDSLTLDAEVALGAYTWNTGDTTPQITVYQTGIYAVTSTNLCRSDWDTIDIKFTDLPTVDLGNDTAVCIGNSITLNARGDTLSTYIWTDQSTDSTLEVNTSGMYRVTATNLCGDRIDAIHVRIADTPVVNLGPDTILCPDGVHILDAFNSFTQAYTWSTGETKSQVQAITEGNYSVTLDHLCGIYSDSVEIRFDKTPITDLGPDSVYCFGDLVELDAGWSNADYLWNTGSRDSIIQAVNEGNYWVQVTNLCGSDQDTVTLWFHLPIDINLGEDTIICTGETFDLAVSSHRAHYLWNTGSTDSIITVTGKGVFSVRAENACGIVQDTLSVREIQQPLYAFNEYDTACVGEELTFEVKRMNDASLIWFDGSNRSKRTFNQTGSYGFTLENRCGVVTDTARANFQNYPEVNLGSDTLVCPGEELELQAPNNLNYVYEWNTGNTEYNQIVTGGGNYRVTLSTSAGCATVDEVRVADCGPQIFIPNAFSPNGDGLNDVFKIESVRLDKFWIRIFDRWGREVFYSTNPDFEWDGTYRGTPVNEGVYTFRVFYGIGDYQNQERFGTVTVIR